MSKTLYASAVGNLMYVMDLVENGYVDTDEENRLRENRKKDAKALFFIQQAVHETLFSKILAATTAKEAWMSLQISFQGSTKVITVKLQILCRDFETLNMKSGESVQDFLTRLSGIVNPMRSYGEEITDETVVVKVLRSLTPKFDHVVAAIEESKDLSIFSFDELMGSLQAHEARLNRSQGKGRGNRGRIQCFHCKRYGHVKADCWYNEVNFAEQNDEESKLFMAYFDTNDVASDVWFVDSGCSNHMSGIREMFRELDKTQKMQVKLGDNKNIQVEGEGTVAIKTNNGKVKLLHDVQFVPKLAHNLLSVGQLMAGGYTIIFDDGECVIKDKKSGQTIVNVHMTKKQNVST
ncbi:uncharacterized protein LOC109821619 [Asparagus officinalis]|uniref:uncharacterized protein LOC109821619 n=1 Tax=Asparagus officinalis TaxID=4686 RepID=UPI00098E6BF0|nr:uncharacterized protein LOC109821619 [Asparagus officinalis]